MAAIGFRALIVMDWDDFVVPAGLRPAMAFEADNGLKRRSGRKWQPGIKWQTMT